MISAYANKLLSKRWANTVRAAVKQQQSLKFSTNNKNAPDPLFLWLGKEGKQAAPVSERALLLPSPTPQNATVLTPDDVVMQVNGYYSQSDHFVGGMGEDDPGVWFASIHDDVDSLEFIDDVIIGGIQFTKQERHGVPFGIYTSGLFTDGIDALPPKLFSTLEVSLIAGSPKDYAAATGRSERDFGQVCSFIVQAVEQQMASEIHVGVLSKYARNGRDLAISLGAQNVQVY